MDISGLAVRIIFLLLPGAIAASLYWKLKGRATRKDWEDFLEVIIFSIFSYLLYAICTYVLGCFNFAWIRLGLQAKTFTQFQAFFDEKVPLDLAEVFYVSLLSIPLAVLASYSYEYKWLDKVGQKIRVTRRFGDEDVWDFFLRSPNIKENWAIIRDHKLNLYYFCWIETFSDSGKVRELVLREVHVYDEYGTERYKADLMYLSRKEDELSIEVVIASIDGEERVKDSKKSKLDAIHVGRALQRRRKR